MFTITKEMLEEMYANSDNQEVYGDENTSANSIRMKTELDDGNEIQINVYSNYIDNNLKNELIQNGETDSNKIIKLSSFVDEAYTIDSDEWYTIEDEAKQYLHDLHHKFSEDMRDVNKDMIEHSINQNEEYISNNEHYRNKNNMSYQDIEEYRKIKSGYGEHISKAFEFSQQEGNEDIFLIPNESIKIDNHFYNNYNKNYDESNLQSKAEIKYWFENVFKDKESEINYRINDDLTVDVDGDIAFDRFHKVDNLPFQFGTVSGDFDISENDINTLKGVPFKVGGGFDCSKTKIESLKHAPLEIGGSVDVGYFRNGTEDPKLKEFLKLHEDTLFGPSSEEIKQFIYKTNLAEKLEHELPKKELVRTKAMKL